MIDTPTGTVLHELCRQPAGYALLRCRFFPDSAGAARLVMPYRIEGVLQRYGYNVFGGSAGFALKLLDRFGVDLLDGAVSGTPDDSGEGSIVVAIGALGTAPVVSDGPLALDFAGDSDSEGVLDVYYAPGYEAWYERGGWRG